MTNLEVLKQLKESGALISLVRGGLMPPKVYRHLEIYYFVDARIQAGLKKSHVVREASILFCIDERNVYRILNSLSRRILCKYG